jgi:hypothetical protein
MKMGAETGNTVDLVKGNLTALRKAFELCLRQIPVAQLDGTQVVKYHGRMSRE